MAGLYTEGESKILSGVYSLILAISTSITSGGRGIVAYPFTADWGPVNELTAGNLRELRDNYNAVGSSLSVGKIYTHASNGEPKKVLGYRMATAEAKVAAATVDTWVFETVYPTTRPFVLVVKDGVEDGSIKISLVENAVELTSFLVSDVDSLVTMVNASDYIRVKTKGSTWVMNWLEIVIKPGIKERTYVNYKASIEKHIIPGIGRYKLKDITDDVIQKYLNDQQEHGNLKLEINDDTGEAAPSHGPVAASSLIQQRRLIIAALEYAVDKGRINRNPGKKTRRPKSKPKTNNILTDEEMETLGIKGTKYRYYPAYMLTLTTACRRGEILGLDWQHVDIGIPWTTVDRYFPWGDIKKLPKWDTKALKTLLEDHNITLGDGYLRLVYQMVDDNGTPFRDELKTDLSRRSLMITEEMVLLLIFWRLIQNTEKRKATERGIEYNPDNLVFCTRKGTYIYPRNFTKMWSENLRSMGIDHKRFHDLRHTVATVMLEDGEAMNTVQEQLGHYDAGFTASRYGHVTAKMRNSAAVKLGERLEKVRNPEAEDEEDANSVKKEDTVIPFQEGRKLKSAACKIK